MDRSPNERRPPDAPDSSQPPDHAADVPHPQDDAPDERERRRHDQTYKALFAHGAAIESLIRDFLAVEWHEHLDLETATLVATETISKGLKRRLADFALRVWFKDSKASVVFLVEFQASHDPDMALRTLDYAVGMVEALRANPTMLDPGDAVPLLLSCVLHTGPKRWPAETSLAALTRTPAPPPAVARAVGGFGTAHRCVVLDLQLASAEGLLPADSLLGWLGALERTPLGAAFPRVHPSLAAQRGGEEHRTFREAFARWTDERMRSAGVPAERREVIVEGIIQPGEALEMGQTYYEEWVEGHERRGMAKGVKKGVKRGKVRGRQEGREEMVLRLASRKFGAETAERLEGLVGAMGPEQLVQVFDAVVDCETGDELLAEAANGASAACRH